MGQREAGPQPAEAAWLPPALTREQNVKDEYLADNEGGTSWAEAQACDGACAGSHIGWCAVLMSCGEGVG